MAGGKTWIEVVNWREFQHYRERKPPWIKLYHSLIDNYEYCCLQDASKLLLLTLYMLAAKTDNRIPNDHNWIRTKGGLLGKIDLSQLIEFGFVICKQDASNALAERLHKTETETETETETDPPISPPSRKKHNGVLSKAELALFEAWYQHYPKKSSRGGAEREWKKHDFTEADIPAMIETLKWQTEMWELEPKRFIPDPERYLSRKKWLDEKPKERGSEFRKQSTTADIPF